MAQARLCSASRRSSRRMRESTGVQNLFLRVFCSILFLRCEIENEHGMQEHLFSLYVTVAGGMDFRAMLMRKKKPAKKVVVVSDTIFYIFS